MKGTPAMDAARKQRIKESFKTITQHEEALTDLVYKKLFSLCPHARAMFPEDMTTHKMQMSVALGLIVKSLENFATVEEHLMEMGGEHADSGVKPDYYPIMSDALLSAMATVSGPAWTPQIEEDWTIAINTIISSMLKGTSDSDQAREAA